MKPILYARLEDLKALVAQAESEQNQDGSLGIVRIPLRDANGLFEIDMDCPTRDRVLVG